MFSLWLDEAFFSCLNFEIKQENLMEKLPGEFCNLETIVFNPPQMMYAWFDGSPDEKYLEKVCVYDPRIPRNPVIALSGVCFAHCSFAKDSQGASNNESKEKSKTDFFERCWDRFLSNTSEFFLKIWRSYFGGKFEFLANGPIFFLQFFIGAIFMSIIVSGTFFTSMFLIELLNKLFSEFSEI